MCADEDKIKGSRSMGLETTDFMFTQEFYYPHFLYQHFVNTLTILHQYPANTSPMLCQYFINALSIEY